jgi:hypothetical protein
VLRCSSVVVEEGAFVRDCRRIAMMEVMDKVVTEDYSASSECGEGRGIGEKGMGRRGRESDERSREWKKRAEKNSWGRGNRCKRRPSWTEGDS